jgi:multicomponent Na+:H+ antiporter subunit E
MTKGIVLVAWLTTLWVVLWRDPTVGNVIGGLAAAGLVLLLFPARQPARRDHTLRPVPLVKFLGWFTWQLIVANLVVAREVLTPRDHIRSGIVAVPLQGCSDLVVTVIADAITLTPGTMTLEVQRDPTVIYVHVLHLYDIDQARKDITTVQRLVVRAIGSSEAVRYLDEAAPEAHP